MISLMKTVEILKSLKTNSFILNSNIPMGYTPGIPMMTFRNEEPCLVIPFLKYQITGEVDKTRVFPPRYVIFVTIKNRIVVKYEDLIYNCRFEGINFEKPVGLFRHTAIRHLKKDEYNSMRRQLYSLLDRLACSMMREQEFDEIDSMSLKRLMGILLEPSIKPFYHAIDKSFFESYIIR